MIFKRLLLLIGLLCLINLNTAFSQNSKTEKNTSFKVVENNSNFNDSYFIDALNAAEMEKFRLKSKDVMIKFKEGATINIISASELYNNGKSIILHNYNDDFKNDYAIPIFSIAQNGSLLAEYKKKLK